MMKYDLVIIGFGKGGKTIAKFAAAQGQSVAVIEKSEEMYGGTCINVGCIPSKTLFHGSRQAISFDEGVSRKRQVVQALNKKNFNNLNEDDNIKVLNYKAQFKSNDEIELLNEQNEVVETISGDHIIINTGAKPVIPEIDGVKTSKYLYDSTGIMNLAEQPKRLVIIGGGYIALEFAATFTNYGTEVTVIERSGRLMAREDDEIAAEVVKDMTDRGINFVLDAQTERITDKDGYTVVETSQGSFETDAVLLATGRQPNTDLALSNTDVKLGEHGQVKVDQQLRTTVPHIYALGDVKGGMQFTYISLDDFRIVRDALFGEGTRTTANRGAVPYTVFIDPPLSRVGLTAAEAREQGCEILENTLPVNQIPRHKVNNDPRGLFKVVIDAKTDLILGATLYGAQSEELINQVKLAIDQNIPYQVLRDNIYTHPTMIESFNDLFNIKQ
ncbi:SidA/IucD/PvdA family monooxygenase [Macrococcus equipercicus]|uniref:SidA/IucD/PvdA family monooxygenase n=1 Tax=Macrococcus equipercicus TaxID=69967 RepID=A0ABQ6RAX8_9STAP|nr:hypothiocyanous acid reductase MerA [Macrococcus equipercicus]KAA1042319.1 SidA/IucD/PvdA family monooxygenase [Macrococcus equipercicus]